MADGFSREKRSEIMAKVRSEDTAPEIVVRKLLHELGFRFRLHRKDLPGKPDIVLPKYHAVIFVHGCFWHGCPRCRHAQIRPRTNSGYWNAKLDRTKERDQRHIARLQEMGWRVFVVWECETRKKRRIQLKERLFIELQSG